jgi:hypothetical protein
MPNEFIARNGLIALNNTTITGSLNISSSAATQFQVGTNLLFVSGSGNVGIGTTAPFTTLEITTPTYGAIQFNGTSLRLGQHSGIGYNRIYADTSTSTWIFDYSGILQFRYQSIPKTVLDASGSIGIGVLTPSASLHISGASSANLLRIDSPVSSSIIYVSGSGAIGFNQTSSLTSQATFRGVLGSTYLTEINTTANGGYGLRTDGPVKAGGYFFNNAGGGSIQTAGGVSMMSFDNLLNVGIAVSSSIGARLHIRGTGATSATTAFLLQNATPTTLMTVLDNGQFIYTTPTMSLAASQSVYTISPIISASNIIGGQYYGVNITPTFWQTTASQIETAFRVAATFTQSSAAATSGSNIIADFGATSVGSQLTITDVTSGSIYMVNDVSGLPIIEATSDWTVNMYNFPNIVFQKTGSNVNITGSLRVTGSLVMSPTSSFVFPLSQSASPLIGSAYWSGSLLFIWDGSRYRSSSFA